MSGVCFNSDGLNSSNGVAVKKAIRVFSGEFKLKVVRRMLAGENVSASAHELKAVRKILCLAKSVPIGRT
jgi:hypothetical protein